MEDYLHPVRKRGGRWKLWLSLCSSVILLLLGLSYLAYSKKKFLPLATEAVGQFHSRFRQGQDDLIYDEADAGWWKATDRVTSQKFFSRVRRKLGACQYSGPLGWRVDTNTTGTFISLSYQAACSKGSMEETFTWHDNLGMLKLFNYNANSKALLSD